MAVSPKSQLLKLGIGTMSVVAIVGATGWVWEATTAAGQPQPELSGPQWEGDHEDDEHGWDDEDDDDDHGQSFRLARPGNSAAPSGRVRTRRS